MLYQVALIALLLACALYDFVEYRIPNVLTAAMVVLFGLWALTRGLPLVQLSGHVVVGAAVFVVAGALFCLRLLGGGDVKLLAATCLWAGPNAFLAHLVVTSFIAVGLLVAILFARRLYPVVLAYAPRLYAMPVPRILQHGEGIPYGIAISASAVILGLPVAI